jgi:hypothetical protein
MDKTARLRKGLAGAWIYIYQAPENQVSLDFPLMSLEASGSNAAHVANESLMRPLFNRN